MIGILSGGTGLILFLHQDAHQNPASAEVTSEALTLEEFPVTEDPFTAGPVGELLGDIVRGDYGILEEVASGRFLRDAKGRRDLALIEKLDRETMRCVRRGRDWILVESDGWTRSIRGRQPFKTRIRFVKDEDLWKIEHLRLVPDEQNSPPRP